MTDAVEPQWAEDAVVEEVDCEQATSQETPQASDETRESGEELSASDEDASLTDDVSASGACAFLAAGGGWGGSQAPVNRAIAIARSQGLTITSQKRSWGNPGSDHHTGQRSSYAADMSNGSAPTPQMDRTAAHIARRLGRPGWTGGYLTVRCGRVRAQLIWRVEGHFNHVHFGVRVE